MNIARSLGKLIQNGYKSHPKISNSITGFVAFASGDLIAQSLESQSQGVAFNKSEINLKLIFQVGCLGIFINGFVLHYWFRILDRVMGKAMGNMWAVTGKALADQLFFAPVAILLFFSTKALQNLEGDMSGLAAAVYSKMERDFLTTYLADWSMWPAVNMINFRFIPISYRPTFVGFAQLIWQTYMSLSCAHDVKKPESANKKKVES
jgi:protein Mpv17